MNFHGHCGKAELPSPAIHKIDDIDGLHNGADKTELYPTKAWFVFKKICEMDDSRSMLYFQNYLIHKEGWNRPTFNDIHGQRDGEH